MAATVRHQPLSVDRPEAIILYLLIISGANVFRLEDIISAARVLADKLGQVGMCISMNSMECTVKKMIHAAEYGRVISRRNGHFHMEPDSAPRVKAAIATRLTRDEMDTVDMFAPLCPKIGMYVTN